MPGTASISWLVNNVIPNVSISQTGNGQGSPNISSSSLSGTAAGCLLVFCTTAADSSASVTDCSVSSSPSLAWTKRVDVAQATTGSAEIWTAVFSAGGSITVTGDWGAGSGSFLSTSSLYEMKDSDTSVGGATATAVSQTNPSVNITTNRANSILIMVCVDWLGVDGAARVYRNLPVTEVKYAFVSTQTTAYHWYKIVTTATTYTEGLTAPTFTGAGGGVGVLEIRGN